MTDWEDPWTTETINDGPAVVPVLSGVVVICLGLLAIFLILARSL